VAPGDGERPARRQTQNNGLWNSVALGGRELSARRYQLHQWASRTHARGSEGGSARRCLQHWEFLRRLVPCGTCPPLGGLEAGSTWRYVSPARRFCCCNLGLLIL